MKIVHMADVHLGAWPDKGTPWGWGRDRQLWTAFEEAVLAAERMGADLLLIAGDLFHRQPLKKELKEVNSILSMLTRTKVVIMAGNHDYLMRNSFYRTYQWADHIHFLKSEEMECIDFPELNTKVYGFSYEHREILQKPYGDFEPQGEGYHILLAHGGDEKHAPFRMEELKGQFDYVAFGHIHKPQRLDGDRIIMAGSLQPLDHTEVGPHGYWVVNLEEATIETSFISIKSCEYVTVEIRMDDTMTNHNLRRTVEKRLEELEEFQLVNLILTGTYDPEVPPDTEMLEQLERVVSVERLCKPNYEIQKLRNEYEHHIIGRFIKELEKMPQNETVRRALNVGLDALMGNTDDY